ncbi:hypothetical protein MasN3_18550 [Massilia varians]|uniref:DUF2384 domain-containing protein n=1 Tax=Massilia varians TaxID=457921 RepID=A0ABM8C562_9BURK|nr:antitoxin Xre-like helix-turn-helix domain-containing protein [Massilia varians]BDT58361.1 hypothetical protein MasN3_18550 [Massilia varians]
MGEALRKYAARRDKDGFVGDAEAAVARPGTRGGMDAVIEATVMHSFQSGARERIDEIRQGVPARRIGELSGAMDVPKERLVDSLGLSRATVNRKAQRGEALSREESERVVGMQALIGQVQAMVAGGGASDAGFDAARWLAQWLAQPLPALGGDTPASYLDTVEGQKLVGKLLAMAESGAYA